MIIIIYNCNTLQKDDNKDNNNDDNNSYNYTFTICLFYTAFLGQAFTGF